jgi:hypothetical protein
MTDETLLRDKLRKIEALYAGGATPGERSAAQAAAERIRARLTATATTEEATEQRFSVPDNWSRQLLIALCRRYGIKPYRYPRMHRQTIIVKNTALVRRHRAVARVPGDQRRIDRLSVLDHRARDPRGGVSRHRRRRGDHAGKAVAMISWL